MKHIALSLAASAALLGLQTVPAFAGSYKGPTGLQLYSLRADFDKDVPGTMKFVSDLGFREVEVGNTYKLTPVEFKKLLDANKLKPIAGHFPYNRLRDDPEGVAQEAKVIGLKYVGCAWIPHKGNFDEAQCRAAAEVFNKAGAVFARHGMKCFYHVHGYEFRPLGDGTVFDLLMTQTDPKFVTFEMDILWVVFPGQCPVKLFEKYGKRWELVHLKDLKKGVKTGEHTGHTDVTNDVALGSGQMDYPAILKAAQKAGVKYYFIEDESPSVREQLPQSLKFLKQVKW
ncbi:MAG: sugar phosphate isomerase [Verrucomicrobia bacterium GWF2_62_7]|nr:MAG: sugar phosphate isomerase [Verrucomicrobia bacterium GWF2_62_7]